MNKLNFIDRCVNGTVKDPIKEMGREVIEWMQRRTDDKRTYREFLGMTPAEYKKWYSRSDSLAEIIKARQLDVKVQEVLNFATRSIGA